MSTRTGDIFDSRPTAITDAAPMSPDQMESLGAALIRCAEAIRAVPHLHAEIARLETELRDRDMQSIEHSRDLMGTLLHGALNGAFTGPKATEGGAP